MFGQKSANIANINERNLMVIVYWINTSQEGRLIV